MKLLKIKINVLNFLQILIFSCYILVSQTACGNKISEENKLLILAKRSTQSDASKGTLHSMKYVWGGKVYGDIHSFDARYSRQSDYFLIYIDKKNPINWIPLSRPTYGYSDTAFIPDSLKHGLQLIPAILLFWKRLNEQT